MSGSINAVPSVQSVSTDPASLNETVQSSIIRVSVSNHATSTVNVVTD